MNDPSVAILVLLGIPGSGKSTFVEEFKRFVSEKNMNVVHICYDHLVPQEQQRRLPDQPGEWKELRRLILAAVDFHISKLSTNSSKLEGNPFVDMIKFEEREVDNRILFVIDDNNYLQSMRYEYYQIAKKRGIGFVELYFNADIHTALRNNEKRFKDRVPDDIIKKMKDNLEPPNPLKNSWEKFAYALPVNESSKLNLEMVHSVIETSFLYPEDPVVDDSEEREKDRVVCSENLIHQVDVHLRSIVNKQMSKRKSKDLTKEEMRKFSSLCQNIKQKLLEDVRAGNIDLDRILMKDGTNEELKSKDELESAISQLFQRRLHLQDCVSDAAGQTKTSNVDYSLPE